MAITDTGKEHFPTHIPDGLVGGLDYCWDWIASKGRSGGILLGVNTASMDLLAIHEGDFNIKFHLQNKVANFKWSLVAVYGVAQDGRKASFLKKLVNSCRDNLYPLMIGGDFNII